MFTEACHRYNQIPLKVFLVFSFSLRDGLPCQPFAPQFPIKILCVTCSNHLTFRVCIILKISGSGCKSWKHTLCSSFHPPISPVSVDIDPLSTLLSHSIYISHLSILCKTYLINREMYKTLTVAQCVLKQVLTKCFNVSRHFSPSCQVQGGIGNCKTNAVTPTNPFVA